MKNKFPGTCGCGKRVAEGKGILSRVDDSWAVSCAKCPATGAPVRAARPASTKSRTAGKARTRSVGKRTARAGAARLWKPRKGASFRTKGRTALTKVTQRAAPQTFTEPTELDWNLNFMPLRYDTAVTLADGMVAQCTWEYEALDMEAKRTKSKAREMELLVVMAELRTLGHLGEPDFIRLAA